MTYFRTNLQKRKPVFVKVPHKKTMMCLNESTLNPFSVIEKDFLQLMKEINLNRYFSDITQELETRLSEYVGIPKECIIYGNGADEMLYNIFNSVRENNNSFAISLAPSYFDYKSYSSAVGLGIKFLYLEPDYDFDAEEYLKLGDSPDCKLAILCNPNNPTGNLLDDNKIRKVLKDFQGLVLIDETYFEFSRVTYQNLLDDFPNLIIVRSFSKAFSAAGVRFGYMISNQKNIYEIRKTKTVFSMSLLIQTFVVSILKNKDIFLDHTNKVIELREKMYLELTTIDKLVVKQSNTNFLPFSIGELTNQLFNFLMQYEIAVRDIGAHPLIRNYLRVTISSETDNKLFVEKVKKFLDQN